MCFYGYGYSSSAAPLERRKMYPNAKLLIHAPYCPGFDGALDVPTLDALRAGLDAEREKMLSIYVERCGVDRGLLEAQMEKETWFGGEAAKQLGFISEVIMPKSAKVSTIKTVMKKKETTVSQSCSTDCWQRQGMRELRMFQQLLWS